MNVRTILKRILGNTDPAPPHLSLDQLTEDAAKARVRLGQAEDNWHREAARLLDQQQGRPRPRDIFHVGD